MATEIGSITTLIGTATATSLDGTIRNLQVGDKVFQNDIITTGAAGAIEIEFEDGSVMDLGRNSQAVLDLDMFDPDAPVAQTVVTEQTFDDIEAIQQALLDGEDPTLIADPAAAGAVGEASSEGGSSTVVREYLNPSMTPQNGFDTTGPSISFLTPEQTQFLNLTLSEASDDDSPVTPIVPPTPSSPVNLLSLDTLSFNEANLEVGTSPDTSLLSKTGSFTVSAPDGLQTLTIDSNFIIENGNFDNNTLPTITSASGNTLIITDVTQNQDGTFSISYSYTLNSAVEHSQPENDDELDKSFQIVATDTNGTFDTANLIISIEDDNPIVTSTQPEIGFEMIITNFGSITAGYNNSYGYYVKGENGQPVSGEIIFANVKQDISSTVLVEGVNPEDIGFFIIPNGATLNPSLENGTEVSFQQLPNGNWQAVMLVEGVATPLNGQNAPALFENTALNASDYQYVTNNQNPGNQNWEDIAGGGDNDNNDVNVNVEINVVNALKVNERFLADGDENTTAVASLDITQYFSSQYGADGAGSALYTLNIDTDAQTGLKDTASGETVLLRYQNNDPDSGVVEGYVNTDSDGIVFTVSLAEDGVVTLEQLRAVFHDDPTDPIQALNPATINPGAISVVLTVTDSDGDPAQASIDLGVIMAFTDDGPSAENYLAQEVTAGETTSGQFTFSVGADGGGLSSVNGVLLVFGNEGWSQLIETEFGLLRVTESGQYEYQSLTEITQDASETLSLIVTDGDGDFVSFESEFVINALQNPEMLSLLMSVGNEQLITSNTNFIINGSFEDINGVDANGIVITGLAEGSLTGGQLVSRQSITGWELVDPDMPAMEPHAAGHGNVGTTDGQHYMDLGASPGNSAIFQQVSGLLEGQNYTLRFDYLDKALKMANSSSSGVMEVIWNGDVVAVIEGENRNNWKTAEFSLLAGAGDGTNTLIFNEIGSIDNHGIAIDNVSLSPSTVNDYYQYELSVLTKAIFETDANPGILKIDATFLLSNGVAIAGEVPVRNFQARTYEIEVENNEPITLTLISENPLSAEFINSIEGQISFVNAEGELVSSSSNVFVEITGSDADDSLIGTDANELIYGGAGNDILTGGAGADIFAWKAGDEGSSVTPAFDIVMDFNAVEGDVLDFSDLLQGEESGDITNFISITQDGNDVVINLTPAGNGEMTQTVKLQDTSFNDLGIGGFDPASQQAQIIQTLINNGQINVDQS